MPNILKGCFLHHRPHETNMKMHLSRANRRRLILLNKTRRYASKMKKSKRNNPLKKTASGLRATTLGGATYGDKGKVNLTPDSLVSYCKYSPSALLQSASDLAAWTISVVVTFKDWSRVRELVRQHLKISVVDCSWGDGFRNNV